MGVCSELVFSIQNVLLFILCPIVHNGPGLLVYTRASSSCSLCSCHQLVQLVFQISYLRAQDCASSICLLAFYFCLIVVQNVFAFYSLIHRAQLCLDGPGLLVYARVASSCSLRSCHQLVQLVLQISDFSSYLMEFLFFK